VRWLSVILQRSPNCSIRLDEDHRGVAAAAIELMWPMRHDDRAGVFPPGAAGTIVHHEASAHREGDLDRVLSVPTREPGIAADPETAAAPQKHTTDTDDRPRAPRRGHGLAPRARHKSAVSFKPAPESLCTILHTNQAGSPLNLRSLP
jgi:hypothetical protein